MTNPIFLLFLTIFLSHTLLSQDRVKPGAVYQPGDSLTGPRYGIVTVVPEGWTGMLPTDTDIFFLVSTENPDGQIFVRAYNGDYDLVRERWKSGLPLDRGVIVRATGEVLDKKNYLESEVEIAGNTRDLKGSVAAMCSEYGACLSVFVVGPSKGFDGLKAGFQKFLENTTMVEPTLIEEYQDFSWSEYLLSKYLVTFTSYQNYKKENHLWLCADGTFKSKLNRKGLAKESSNKYFGKKKGTWRAEGVGATGKLYLAFKKLNEIEVLLEITEEKIHMNNERYFVMESPNCK